MAKKKTRTRRDATPGVPPATGRGGGGHAEKRATSGKTARDADPRTAEFLVELNKFTKRLRTSVNAASRFYWDFLEKKNKWPRTKRGETRFSNQVTSVAAEVRELAENFSKFREDCPEHELCRSLISTLDVGLAVLLNAIADELEEIASRAAKPLTATEENDLLDDLRSLGRTLEAVLTVAEWIEDEVKAIRGPLRPGETARAPLPGMIDEWLISSEEAARNVALEIRSCCERLERWEKVSTAAFLRLLKAERQRLDEMTKHLAETLHHFDDSHREAAEKGGHEELLRFLDNKKSWLGRLAARRGVGVVIHSGLINLAKRRLSYDDESPADEAVLEILYALDLYHSRLSEQREWSELLETQAAEERAAAAVRESDLPEWDAIVRAREGDGSRLAGLDMLVEAFLDETRVEEDAPSFLEMTQEDLRRQLAKLYPKRWSTEKSLKTWVARHLVIAEEFGIVVPIERSKRTSPRVGYQYRVTDAAVNKRGKHVAAIRPTEPRPS
jgi:hypothetical protein